MAKPTDLYIKLEPELKEQAELILEQLGIPVSNAINIFLRQVVIQRGIPFEIKLSSPSLIEIAKLTEEEFNRELEKGYKDYINGNVKPLEEVFSSIYEEYEI